MPHEHCERSLSSANQPALTLGRSPLSSRGAPGPTGGHSSVPEQNKLPELRATTHPTSSRGHIEPQSNRGSSPQNGQGWHWQEGGPAAFPPARRALASSPSPLALGLEICSQPFEEERASCFFQGAGREKERKAVSNLLLPHLLLPSASGELPCLPSSTWTATFIHCNL